MFTVDVKQQNNNNKYFKCPNFLNFMVTGNIYSIQCLGNWDISVYINTEYINDKILIVKYLKVYSRLLVNNQALQYVQ